MVRRARAAGLSTRPAPVYGAPAGVFETLPQGELLYIREHQGRAYAERVDTYGRVIRRYWLESL